jgi:glycosyltransferase involved in cell wall biosynthesis
VRIGLNLLHAFPEIGGSWNYIASLVSALGEWDEINTYFAYVTGSSECLVPAKPNLTPVRVNLRPAVRRQRILYENTALQLAVRRQRLDCMHWFANTQALLNTVPGAVTVYDLHPFLGFVRFSPTKRFYLRAMMRLAAWRARMLLPMSQATAEGLQCILHVRPERIVVIPPVVGSQFRPAAGETVAGFRSRYGLPDRFWLYVAHLYPHKNHVRLLEAYRRLKSSGLAPWPLVLRGDPAGAEREVDATIARLGLEGDVIPLARLSQEELPALFSAATALVFPSLHEGGGIPVVEAMACGCPVVASGISAVREFAGDAASYFDPLDVAGIAEAMRMLQDDAAERERSRQAGLARADEFRGQKIVNRLLGAYRGALRG